uniref:Uncharacterized protein n=1 Tax=Arundo donax TaxID=35708 RepID=A0A0A9BSR7_ARUDO
MYNCVNMAFTSLKTTSAGFVPSI